jgi:dipeptidyl aminopeptidase/acylaminoacyl peptidase
MRRLFMSFLALIAFTFPTFAQVKHPFTFADMMKLKRVGEPEVSPDGKWVIFSVVDVNLDANTKTPHIWIVPLSRGGEKSEEKRSEEKSGVPHVSPPLRDVGGTEREIISDQDGDRPRWAPDGKRFAFLSTKGGGSQVWIADFDAAAGIVTGVHKLTSIATEAGGELWSPDGKNILFTSDVYPECDGAPEAETACNARKLEEHEKSKVKALIFDHLLYRHWNAYKEGKRSHIFVVPIDACVGAAAKPALSGAEGAVQPGEAGQRAVSGGGEQSRASLDRTAEGGCPHISTPRDLTPGDYDAPVFSLGGQDNYAFSPDGQEICYTSNHDKNEAASTNNDLWIVPVNVEADASSAQVLAQTRNITADNPASDSTPLYSPDGRYIAYRAQQRPGYESDRFTLNLYDRKTGRKTRFNPSSKTDFWVGTFAWAPDSSKLYFVAEDKGESPIYSVSFKRNDIDDAAGGDVTIHNITLDYTELGRGFNDDLSVTGDGHTLLFSRMSIAAPAEIYSLSLTMKMPCNNRHKGEPQPGDCEFPKPGPFTHFNDEVLSQVAMSPLESFWFPGANGDKVEGFLVRPPNFDPSKKYPVKFLIHGGPQGAWGDDWSYRWNPELFAAPTSGSSNSTTSSGYVVIMINFHGSTGYGQKFIDAINGDWGGAPFEDLMKGLDYAEAHYGFIDKDRECALGASYGGYMANWILGHTDRFKCIVSHDGMFNAESAWGTTEELWFNDWEFKGTPYDNRAMYQKWSPHQYAKNFKTPTLVIHGQRDYRLDVSEGFQLFTTLQMGGVASKMLYFPDEGHWVLKPQNSRLWYETVNAWVDQWTKK